MACCQGSSRHKHSSSGAGTSGQVDSCLRPWPSADTEAQQAITSAPEIWGAHRAAAVACSIGRAAILHFRRKHLHGAVGTASRDVAATNRREAVHHVALAKAGAPQALRRHARHCACRDIMSLGWGEQQGIQQCIKRQDITIVWDFEVCNKANNMP